MVNEDKKTNEEIFSDLGEENEQLRKRNGSSKGGRPKINRELFKELYLDKKSVRYIRKVMHISLSSYHNLVKELEDQGITRKTADMEKVEKALRDFDTECMEAKNGLSFYKWITGQRKDGRYIFSFCRKVWEKVWDKPQLYMATREDSTFADQLALRFLEVMAQNEKSARTNVTLIRRLFFFLGREDICRKYLGVAKYKRNKRDVPQLAFVDSPTKVDDALKWIRENYGENYELAIKLKIITLMRTGAETEGRELYGVKCGVAEGSYLIMNSPEEFIFKINAKKGLVWNVRWLGGIAERLYELYRSREKGEPLIQVDVRELRKAWRQATEKAGLPSLILHDARKIAITWLYVYGLRLEIATDINVGWKDLSTAKEHYIQFRGAIRKDMRQKFKANIPTWFTKDLDQYMVEF